MPCGIDEICARIWRFAPRKRKALKFGEFEFHPREGIARHGPAEISLTRTQLAILDALIERVNEVISRSTLLDSIQASEDLCDRSLDSHIYQLRKRLKLQGVSEISIQPVYGCGYRLVESIAQ